MKQLQVWFEDNDHDFIKKIKDELHGGNWRDYIMDLSRLYKAKGELNPSKEGDASNSIKEVK